MNLTPPSINSETYRRLDIFFPHGGNVNMNWVFTQGSGNYLPEGQFQLDLYLGKEKLTFVQGLSLQWSGNTLTFDENFPEKTKGEYRLHEVLPSGKLKPFFKGVFEGVFDLKERNLEPYQYYQIIQNGSYMVNVAVSVISGGEDLLSQLQSLPNYGVGKTLLVTHNGIEWVAAGTTPPPDGEEGLDFAALNSTFILT